MSVLVIGMGGVRVNVARRFADEEYKVVCYHIAPRRGIDFLGEVNVVGCINIAWRSASSYCGAAVRP